MIKNLLENIFKKKYKIKWIVRSLNKQKFKEMAGGALYGQRKWGYQNHIQIKDVKVKGTTIEVSASKANPPGVAHMRHLKRKHKKTLRHPLIMSAPERGEGSSLSLHVYIYIYRFYLRVFL